MMKKQTCLVALIAIVILHTTSSNAAEEQAPLIADKPTVTIQPGTEIPTREEGWFEWLGKTAQRTKPVTQAAEEPAAQAAEKTGPALQEGLQTIATQLGQFRQWAVEQFQSTADKLGVDVEREAHKISEAVPRNTYGQEGVASIQDTSYPYRQEGAIRDQYVQKARDHIQKVLTSLANIIPQQGIDVARQAFGQKMQAYIDAKKGDLMTALAKLQPKEEKTPEEIQEPEEAPEEEQGEALSAPYESEVTQAVPTEPIPENGNGNGWEVLQY